MGCGLLGGNGTDKPKTVGLAITGARVHSLLCSLRHSQGRLGPEGGSEWRQGAYVAHLASVMLAMSVPRAWGRGSVLRKCRLEGLKRRTVPSAQPQKM